MSVEELRAHVAAEIGAIAKPKTIYLTPDLPKTRSGKIMRRLLRDVAEGRNLGDTTTLADATVVDEIRRRRRRGPAGGVTRTGSAARNRPLRAIGGKRRERRSSVGVTRR